MSRIFVRGAGAVSPAGWGVAALSAAAVAGDPLPLRDLPRPGWSVPLRIRSVPPPPAAPACLAHPRLRRAGQLTQHTVVAALEALGTDLAEVQAGRLRVGIIVCLLTGIVAYSRRFYEAVLQDPATASPLLFPETVFNAPASHLAAYLGAGTINYTLVGDEGSFLQGLALAAQWINDEPLDGCLVVGGEEMDWPAPDALRHFSRRAVHGSGAGALYLSATPTAAAVELAAVTDSFTFTLTQSRTLAARNMRAQLPAGAPGELLCLSGRNLSRFDAAETAAWADWTGPRLAPKEIFGEAFTASAAWQCALACASLRGGGLAAVNVSVVGGSQQAIGARFIALPSREFPMPDERNQS